MIDTDQRAQIKKDLSLASTAERPLRRSDYDKFGAGASRIFYETISMHIEIFGNAFVEWASGENVLHSKSLK